MTTSTAPRSSSELPRLAAHEQNRYGAAAECALRLYPGPVGELIHRELIAYGRFGRCFAKDALIPDLMRQIMTPPDPSPDEGPEAVTGPAGAPAPSARERWGGLPRTPDLTPSRSAARTTADGRFFAARGPVLWPRPPHTQTASSRRRSPSNE